MKLKTTYCILILILVHLDLFSQGNDKVKLLHFTSSECDNDINYLSVRNRIISLTFKDSILNIQVGLLKNCCLNDHGAIKYNQDTLFLYSNGKESSHVNENGDTTWISSICDCDCCFSFNYEISGLKKIPKTIISDTSTLKLSKDKYYIKPIKFELLDNDTVNYSDKYGFRQGWHVKYNERKQLVYKLFYKDNIIETGIVYIKYYESGELKSEYYVKNDKNYRKVEYFTNGKIKRDCLFEEQTEDNAICKEYDENGKIIKIN